MKKRLLFVFVSLFSFALVLLLASCSPYNGNYTEVTDKEQLLSVEEKVNNLAVESSKKETNYELVLEATVKMDYGKYSTKTGIDSNIIKDKKNKIVYTSYKIQSSLSGEMSGSVKINSELWANGNDDGLSYANFEMTQNYNGVKNTESFKKKGKLKNLDLDILEGYTSMIEGFEDELDLSELVEAIEEKGTKVYTDNNKIKVVYEYQNMQIAIYLVINDDNTYRMKLEVPQCTVEQLGFKMTITETIELIPTSQTVSLPKDEDYEEA